MVTCLATMAYISAAFTVRVTILVLVVNSNWIQILRSYMLFLKPPILIHSCHAWPTFIHCSQTLWHLNHAIILH